MFFWPECMKCLVYQPLTYWCRQLWTWGLVIFLPEKVMQCLNAWVLESGWKRCKNAWKTKMFTKIVGSLYTQWPQSAFSFVQWLVDQQQRHEPFGQPLQKLYSRQASWHTWDFQRITQGIARSSLRQSCFGLCRLAAYTASLPWIQKPHTPVTWTH